MPQFATVVQGMGTVKRDTFISEAGHDAPVRGHRGAGGRAEQRGPALLHHPLLPRLPAPLVWTSSPALYPVQVCPSPAMLQYPDSDLTRAATDTGRTCLT